jgi:hypothetical protein
MRGLNASGQERKVKLSSFCDGKYPIVFEGDLASVSGTESDPGRFRSLVHCLFDQMSEAPEASRRT